MSEYRASAFLVPHAALAAVPGSRDERLVETVQGGAERLIGGFVKVSDAAVVEAAVAIVQGEATDPDAPAHAFARWVLTAAVATGRPPDPEIGFPFLDLYAVTEVLRETPHARLAAFLEEMNGERDDRLPLSPATFPLPGVGYAAPDRLRDLAPEAWAALNTLRADDDWAADIEEPDDLVQVLSWIDAAADGAESLAVFVDGDL